MKLYYWLSIILMLNSSYSYATSHAVLIGIGDYPSIGALEGPQNDVALMQQTLIGHWGVKPSNISTLVNQQATRQQILDTIDRTEAIAKAGDDVIIYFSGHGTSAADPMLSTPITQQTGAWVPYDIHEVGDENSLYQRLIVGNRDIRPRLMKFDQKKINVVVFIDACYSGNAMRNSHNALPTRYANTDTLLGKKASLAPRKKLIPNKKSPYPYRHIFSLTAAQEYEAAQDIPANRLSYFPTIDGLAHGAFTDSLARVLSHQTNGDLNKDKRITGAELAISIHRLMRERGFSSTPNALPKIDNNKNISHRPLLDQIIQR